MVYKWTEEEVSRLIRLWDTVESDADLVDEFPGRSKQAISSKRSQLGILRRAERSDSFVTSEMGRRIRLARRMAGYGLEDFAKKAGYSRYTIHNWERAYSVPSLRAVEDIAEVLNVTPIWLACWERYESAQ